MHSFEASAVTRKFDLQIGCKKAKRLVEKIIERLGSCVASKRLMIESLSLFIGKMNNSAQRSRKVKSFYWISDGNSILMQFVLHLNSSSTHQIEFYFYT